MNKTLKFDQELADLILAGKKDISWRLFDEKNLQVEDIVILLKRPELKPFARAKVVSVREKPMAQLTKDDKEGHETFKSNDQMYKTYSKYYKRKVTPSTIVKVIKFQLIRTYG